LRRCSAGRRSNWKTGRGSIAPTSGRDREAPNSGVAARAFKALAEKGVNIRAIRTSEIKFSMLIDDAYTELAVRTLHSLYGLDAK
jgi:hypothetical protein